jgi:hypothetical protein
VDQLEKQLLATEQEERVCVCVGVGVCVLTPLLRQVDQLEKQLLATEQEERMLKKQLKKVNDDYRAAKRQLDGSQFTCFTRHKSTNTDAAKKSQRRLPRGEAAARRSSVSLLY